MFHDYAIEPENATKECVLQRNEVAQNKFCIELLHL
jgi:hypothetical protein